MAKLKHGWKRWKHSSTIPKREKEFVIRMLDLVENEPVRYRLSNLIIWYIDEAESYKHLYYGLSLITILANILIPVVNGLGIGGDPLVTTTILATVASIALAFNNLGHFKDNWTRYRVSAELLKELMSEYVTKIQECQSVCGWKDNGCYRCIRMKEEGDYRCPLTGELMEQISSHVSGEAGEWKDTVDREEVQGVR